MKSITFDDFSQKTYAKMKIVACKYMDSDCKGSDQGRNNCLNIGHKISDDILTPSEWNEEIIFCIKPWLF